MEVKRLATIIIIWWVFTWWPTGANGQREQVRIRWKSMALFPGNDIRFFGGIEAKNGGRTSTTLYMQLYEDSGGRPLTTWRWRVDGAVAAGTFLAPDTPGFYWVRAYTLASDTVVFSLRVRPKNTTYTIRRLPDTLSGEFLKHQAVWLSHDDGGYYLLRVDPGMSVFGVSVRDTASFFLPQTFAIQRAAGECRWDTVFLTKRFKALSKKPFGMEEIVYTISNDSTSSIPNKQRIDSVGQLTFSGLSFEDSSYIFYMRNGSQEEITLRELPEPDNIPPFSIPTGYKTDTINRDPTPLPGQKGAKTLDTAFVKLRYSDRNILLHNKYVKGHLYLEAGIDDHFNYDLRVDPPSRWTQDLRDYLHRDVHPIFDAAPEWYLDGQFILPEIASTIDMSTIRYIEIRRGEGVYSMWDSKKRVNYVLIFSKIGKDAMDTKKAFKHLAMKGYDAAPGEDKDEPGHGRFIPKIKTVKYYLGRKPPFILGVMTVVNGQLYYREETIIPD